MLSRYCTLIIFICVYLCCSKRWLPLFRSWELSIYKRLFWSMCCNYKRLHVSDSTAVQFNIIQVNDMFAVIITVAVAVVVCASDVHIKYDGGRLQQQPNIDVMVSDQPTVPIESGVGLHPEVSDILPINMFLRAPQ